MARWNHTPEHLPLETSPLWAWPPRPAAVLRWYGGAWMPLTVNVGILILSLLALTFTTPSLEQAQSPGLWVLVIVIRNALILGLVAGTLHWYFHAARHQGTHAKYDPRPYPRQGRVFTLDDQLRDNVTWAMASGVPVWSLIEAFLWWGMASGLVTPMTFSDHPVWFFGFFLVLPLWESFYFYWIHRLLHWGPFYRFHALHHRNTDVGPFSGLSMHPVEHALFFGSMFIHLLLPTHALHLVFHGMFYAIYAVVTHTGFEGLWLRGAKRLHLGNFHHQMHHRFFEVNYGTLDVPWDKVFGTFDDGTPEARARLKNRIRRQN